MYGKKIKPFTTKEFFDMIMSEIEAKKPELLTELDYYQSSSWYEKEIRTYEFDIETITKYGGSEGIYTDVYLSYGKERDCFGVCKTLAASPEAVRRMYQLAAEIYLIGSDIVRKNIQDFTWSGYFLGKRTETGNDGIEFESLSRASVLLERYFQGIPKDQLILIELASRKEIPLAEIA